MQLKNKGLINREKITHLYFKIQGIIRNNGIENRLL